MDDVPEYNIDISVQNVIDIMKEREFFKDCQFEYVKDYSLNILRLTHKPSDLYCTVVPKDLYVKYGFDLTAWEDRIQRKYQVLLDLATSIS